MNNIYARSRQKNQPRTKMSPPPLTTIPSEVKARIQTFLTAKDRYALSQTNKQMKKEHTPQKEKMIVKTVYPDIFDGTQKNLDTADKIAAAKICNPDITDGATQDEFAKLLDSNSSVSNTYMALMISHPNAPSDHLIDNIKEDSITDILSAKLIDTLISRFSKR